MDEQHDTTDELREELQLLYDAERCYMVARTPEARLQLNADALHDVALRTAMSPEKIGAILDLDEEVIARARD